MKNALSSFLLAATIGTLGGGCVVRAQGHVSEPVAVVEVDEEPPPPRTVVVETRPGFIFIEGRWARHGNRWDWQDGRWERERANQRWEQGRWETRGRSHVWVEGGWRAGGGGGAVVRDHRAAPPPAAPPPAAPAVEVRDHRH